VPPTATGAPQRTTAARPANASSGFRLVNSDSEDSIVYRLNGKLFGMRPGNYQKLATGDAWIVEFDRGADFGSARYKLGPGTYLFAITAGGWDLFENAAGDATGSSPAGAGDRQTAQLPSSEIP
jgi:hypothetical protein